LRRLQRKNGFFRQLIHIHTLFSPFADTPQFSFILFLNDFSFL